MKLQKEELVAVANHIYERIVEKNKVDVTKEEKKIIADYIKQREKINSQIRDLQDKNTQLSKTIFDKLRIGPNFYYHDKKNLEDQVLRVKSKELPNINQIKNEIIMKSLFSSEAELKKFIEELVAKY